VAGERPEDITLLLHRMGEGDAGARETLFRLLYGELHKQARRLMRGQRPDHTLQPSALVHEACIKLLDPGNPKWQNRKHFFCVAAAAMRSVLIDHARAKGSTKRAGTVGPDAMDEIARRFEDRAGGLLDLDEALKAFQEFDPRAAMIVDLRFFGGLNSKEIGELLELSERTVEREWECARTWLKARMG